MAPEQTINCPKCKAPITLTEAIAGPALAEMRSKLQREADERGRAFEAREKDITQRQDALAQTVKDQVAANLAVAKREAAAESQKEVARMQEMLKQNDAKLAEAQKAQADAARLQRELNEKTRELDLEIERRVDAAQGAIRSAAQREAEARFQLTISERETTIEQMRADLDEARQRADQGSQKIQGEVLELNFEQSLRVNFPEDSLSAVPDKVGRGDIHQEVNHNGTKRGVILWELKRTKNWSDYWLPKLRGIQREMKATVAIVCSQVLPEEVESFSCVDGVWVCSPKFAVALTAVLRRWVIEVDQVARKSEGQDTKAELTYKYLTGPQFRHRVEAVVEQFSSMRDDLESEKRALTRAWAKREKQMELVIQAMAGLYGDLQGIAGATVHELPALSLMGEQGKL